jgi:hypothetical protein
MATTFSRFEAKSYPAVSSARLQALSQLQPWMRHFFIYLENYSAGRLPF